MTETPADRPPRRRKPPRPVEVVSIAKLTPRMVSVLVRGDALDGFRIEAPTGHVKVFLPADGQDDPAVRTYTPVRFDEASKTLELQFVLHGTGPASEWAERAGPGDKLEVAGPGGVHPVFAAKIVICAVKHLRLIAAFEQIPECIRKGHLHFLGQLDVAIPEGAEIDVQFVQRVRA